MITERQQENAALHALGLLEGAERASFEGELAGNRELRGLVDSLTAASAAIALTVPQVEPPAKLKAGILAAVAASTTAAPVEPEAPRVIAYPFNHWLPLAAAAGLAITALWLGSQIRVLRQENLTLRTERELAEIAYQTAQSQLNERSLIAENMINDLGRQLRDQEDLTRLKITALASLAGNTPEARAIAVWDPGRETGLLTVEKLPVIADNQDYQIWVVDPAYPNPVDGGVFKPGADGKAVLTFKGKKPIGAVAAFAVSLERKGGVPKAEGPIVLLGKF
jgi:anti-sigma-K factor RskA